MPTPIAMPRQGNTVESCTIVEWHKKKGDTVSEGDILFTYETDKATFEFESPASGTLLDTFFGTDEDIPVLTTVAILGKPGEGYDELKPQVSASPAPAESENRSTSAAPSPPPVPAAASAATGATVQSVSPRARKLADAKGVDISSVKGTGPKGRVIERDVLAAAEEAPLLTRTAAAKLSGDGLAAPPIGTGIGGRVRAADLTSGEPAVAPASAPISEQGEFTDVKLSKLRSIIAQRMHESLQQGAQLTMTARADASSILAYRKKVKAQADSLGLNNINITDMVAYAVTRVLARTPHVNAHILGDTVRQYHSVHLALAVDTPRGLMVPVSRSADRQSLNQLAGTLKSLAAQCQDGSINPDLLTGGTFTVTNLGTFGIGSFTPIVNPPQVAILGLNAISPVPVMSDDGQWQAVPHIGLSLTVDHRALDGAPGARFLNAVVDAIENFELTLSL
jgi:pyruvate dehydrogenase E2 component (dihydrolipoamide acetyltransferase)